MSENNKERIWFVRLDFREDPSNEQCSFMNTVLMNEHAIDAFSEPNKTPLSMSAYNDEESAKLGYERYCNSVREKFDNVANDVDSLKQLGFDKRYPCVWRKFIDENILFLDKKDISKFIPPNGAIYQSIGKDTLEKFECTKTD
jgi:hypothetical protein